MAYFPFFVDLQDKKCFIMGGGEVAYRKAAALLPFGAHIYIKALTYCAKEQTQLTLAYGTFEEADLEGCQFVIAATDDRALNRKIAELCKEKNILINTVDDKELCSFYFPSLIKQDEVVVGISSGGNSPVLTQKIRRTVEKEIPPYYGALNAQLGAVRERVQRRFETEAERKSCFTEIFEAGCIKERPLTAEELDTIINRHSGREHD
mgnify:CR=1 FL=1